MNGLDVQNSLRRNPEIARYLMMYEKCRQIQIIQTEGVKGSGKSQMRTLKTTMYPTGFGVLPFNGGVYDQPYRMMEFFEIFFNEERKAAFNNISS